MPHSRPTKIETAIDLKHARYMQQLILPKKEVLDHVFDKYRLNVTSYYETCNVTGGDFWGCAPVYCDHVGFYIVDCSGHSFSSALSTFRLHALIEDIDDIYLKLIPANFLAVLNKKMCQLMTPGHFATMFYGVVNVATGEMVYSTANATAPIIITKRGAVKVLDGQGFPLGAMKDADFPSRRVKFGKGDRLLLYSDALTEGMNKNGKMFGEDKLVKLLKDNAGLSCSQLIKKMIAKQKDYRNGGLHDDLTVNIYSRV